MTGNDPPPPRCEGLGERLRWLLAEKGISQAELCRMTGLSSAIVSQMVTGATRNPRLDTIAHMAAALGVTIDYLATGTSPCEDYVDTMHSRLNENYAGLDHRFRYRLYEESEILARLSRLENSSADCGLDK